MKTVTVEQFKSFGPCWLETREGRERFAKVAALHDEWTAYDVLVLPDVSAEDKLWAVLREEFIDAPVLHEYACRCAEYALSLIDNPYPRSVAAIEAKRKWLRGEIDDVALSAAQAAACAAAWYAARTAARDAAWAAAWAAARTAARDAAWGAAWYAARTAARDAAWAAAWAAARTAARDAARGAAWYAAWYAARDKNLDILTQLLDETYGGTNDRC